MNSCCRAALDAHKGSHRCPPGCNLECSVCHLEWINDRGAWCKALTLSRRRYHALRSNARLIELLNRPR